MLFNRFYLGESAMVDSWKDKRIKALNRIIENTQLDTLDFLEEYDSICSSKAKNKMEYKLERKGQHEKVDTFNVIRNKLCV